MAPTLRAPFLAVVLSLVLISGSGRRLSFIAADDEQGAVGAIPCDSGVLEYLDGSKTNEAVIPYSTNCVLQYKEMGHHLQLPPTVALHLKGIPKTGTTWVEMFINNLIERVCASGIYKGCTFHKEDLHYNHQRVSQAIIPAQEGGDRSAAIVRFTVGTKHLLTYNYTCDHLSNPDDIHDCMRETKRDKIHNLVRAEEHAERHEHKGEEWRDCVYKGPYSRIYECIPVYMHTMEYPWAADLALLHKAAELWLEGTHVNMDTAQRKYVITLRDPRDAAVSNAHYVSRMNDPTEYIIAKGCRDYIAATALYYYWQVEVQGRLYPTLEILYREAVDNPVEQVEKTLAHIGLRAPKEMVLQTVRETTADAMRKMEEEGLLPGTNSAGTVHAKTRKATYGAYAEELSQEAIDMCNADMRRVLPQQLQRKFGLADYENLVL